MIFIPLYCTEITISKQGNTISYIQLESDGYTPLVIDLIDNLNQRVLYNNDTHYPNDQVEGYTLSQLEQALMYSSGIWWVWRTRIKEMFDNSTEMYVDYLFQTYE